MTEMGEPLEIVRDVVSHRACDAGSRDDARLSEADRLLSAMMIFAAVCVHDGVLAALGCHSLEELDRALAGYRYFGLQNVAEVVVSIVDRAENSPAGEQDRWDFEGELESEYERVCPDTAVDYAFNAFYAQRPDDFAEPSPDDVARHRETTEFIRRL